MLPLVLDISNRKVVVAGRGLAAQARYQYAREAGAGQLYLFVIDQDGWACHAEAAVFERLPVKADLEGAAVVLIAGLPPEETERLVGQARAIGALVNAEDVPEHCDFHVPAIVRRGDLVLTVSTAGQSPALAQRIKQFLSDFFAPVWAQHTRRIAEARRQWRADGRSKDDIARLSAQMIEREGWLKEKERV